nr:unnamed protein product [Digitaria exilis]
MTTNAKTSTQSITITDPAARYLPAASRRRCSDHSDLPELTVQVPAVELPGPPRQHQRHERPQQRHPGDDQERLPEAPHTDAGEVTSRLPSLPPRLVVVHPPGDAHVEDVRPHGARHGAKVVERRVVLEPKHLGDDGEQQRPLRAEAEPEDHRRRVEPVADAEGDQRVADAGEEEHHGEGERARHLVAGEHVLRGEAGDHAPRMLTRDTNVEMVPCGYPSDCPIWPMLSTAVSVPPMPQMVATNRTSMSTLNRAWRIV